MRMSKNIIAITFALLMVSCSYSSLRPEVVDRADAQRMQTVIFATVVSIASIKAGEKFTKDNIWVKRPGTGEILAKDFKSIIGKRAQRDISIDQHLSCQDIDG